MQQHDGTAAQQDDQGAAQQEPDGLLINQSPNHFDKPNDNNEPPFALDEDHYQYALNFEDLLSIPYDDAAVHQGDEDAAQQEPDGVHNDQLLYHLDSPVASDDNNAHPIAQDHHHGEDEPDPEDILFNPYFQNNYSNPLYKLNWHPRK